MRCDPRNCRAVPDREKFPTIRAATFEIGKEFMEPLVAQHRTKRVTNFEGMHEFLEK